ncbi:MAG TPA: T9SS type A sorting domain-containing protein [Bacteroidales bacterium]|nr:T9SS type A sorting domain-containing protein [Bacteroidales bacterium]
MKKLTLLFAIMATGLLLWAQSPVLRSGLETEKTKSFQLPGQEPAQLSVVQASATTEIPAYKATDIVSIIDLGTSANAYGLISGGKSNLMAHPGLNTVAFIHRMGGALNPGGHSGDLAYDVSIDGGMTWSLMIALYTAKLNAGGQYYIDAARYPQGGVYNPIGNTDPNEAYVAFCAATTAGSNGSTWGGICWGRGKIGDPTDTTYNFSNSFPGMSFYVPHDFTISYGNGFWVTDAYIDWNSGAAVYQGNLILTHGIWNEEELDFDVEFIEIEASTVNNAPPADYKIEFSPDGQTGYIVALMDIGEVPFSSGQSYYPVLFRTTDGGLTWSDPIPVALAGEDGIPAVQGFLSQAEIAELYEAPLPALEEIPFTTAFDCDVSVDKFGNPHIAVMIGVTGSTPYSIISAKSEASGYLFMASFLLSSDNMGEEDSWVAYELGRPFSFRGDFGDGVTEDQRIQIARNAEGEKMFVGWLDTDTTVSSENNAPDIRVRGVDIVDHMLTADALGNPLPVNVTYGSEATFSANFFCMANEVLDDEFGAYTIPFVYQEFTGQSLSEPVQYKYIQDFVFTDSDFLIVGIEDHLPVAKSAFELSGCMPNPAATQTEFTITLPQHASISMAVFNIIGQTVKSMPARVMPSGRNSIALDVSDLTSGIYFFTVSDGANSITKKMIVK